MLGCSTVCPKCQHQFTCCPPIQCCSNARRSLQGLSGGGLVDPHHFFAAFSQTSPCPSPQISPSAPLAFVLPPLSPIPPPLTTLAESRPEVELERLSATVRALRQSGWYYEGITYQRSQELLQKTPVGTFLVRESSDPRFLFSLSVQTERGPTSVRIHYVNGYFKLDAQPHLQATMPIFPDVIRLVQYYVAQSRASTNAHEQVWVDPKGKLYSAILLDKPLRREERAPSLKHLARLAVHRAVGNKRGGTGEAHRRLELPDSLSDYLSEYPYSL